MHQAGHAVLPRSLDMEVGCGLAGTGGLRPDARITGEKRAVGKTGPIAADRGVEALRAARVYGIVFLSTDALDPLHVRPEARLAGEVERHVHAEAAGLGNRVDQPRERRAARERIVVALGVELARCELRTVAL